jgi:hypothetical protein
VVTQLPVNINNNYNIIINNLKQRSWLQIRQRACKQQQQQQQQHNIIIIIMMMMMMMMEQSYNNFVPMELHDRKVAAPV